MNTFIIRAYYEITLTDLTSYRLMLHQKFVERFPQYSHVTVQRVSDQYRFIVRSKKIPASTRDRIRFKVTRTARNEESVVDSTNSVPIRRSSPVNIQYHTRHITLLHRPANISSNIRDESQTAYLKYFENDPLHWPKTPRLHTTNATNSNKVTWSKDPLLLPSAIDAGQKGIPPWMADGGYNVSRSNSRLKKYAVKIYRQFSIHRDTPVVEFMDILKQKLSVVCNRLQRYGEAHARRVQNSMYIKNQRQFFSTLGSTDNTRQHASFSVTEAKNYWSALWESSKVHVLHAEWIDSEHNRYASIATMRLMEVTENEVRETIVRSSNWKAPGLDKVQNFWYKQFRCVHN
ncbi:uncharacterized protein LOC119688698 [Teleopsis dalmanni]|uniref:uncharacterized protein LOC119688698 n=1 Tax=Teleopsis dalmanni TaxID=139649 RepID=UPI0018CCD40D|nr:uncharacterized protein LOC119688698 [Teleopsis dalmanni]